MLGSLPDVQFVETDVNAILEDMIESYEETYYQQTGVQKRLYPGDPIRIFIYTQALRELQLREIINYSAKQNLLAYAEGENLDHLAARHGLERFEGAQAVLTVEFTLSSAVPSLIPRGIRLVIDEIYFETTEETLIESGQLTAQAVVISQVLGEEANVVQPGTEMVMVDPLPFVVSAIAVEQAIGGADRETDEELRERVYSSTETLSVAGPEQSYIAMVKNYSNAILDATVVQKSPGVVEITALLQDGELPNEAFLSELENYVGDGTRRPLTDQVLVKAPEEVHYDLNVTYYLLKQQSVQAAELTNSINQAVENYITWQKSKLGRDINPSELIYLLREAGAKRAVVDSPAFAEVPKGAIALCQNSTVVFGGFEDE